MKLYDAKQPQQCTICGYKISHNKQGRFTRHLKGHDLSLENYLIRYFYKRKELECSYVMCDNIVGLTRGIPNKYCNRSCRQKKDPLICIICGSSFEAKNRNTKACSRKCNRKNRSTKTANWHNNMTKEEKEMHFKNIITKTSTTRRQNRTPSWNSGKQGIYKAETIEKIRQATLRQMEKQIIRKTTIEKKVEGFLQNNQIKYKYSFILEKRQFDFLLPDFQVLIECDGDYWHANPKFFPDPEDWQMERMKIDQLKNEIAQKNGYTIVRFWEDDIINKFDYVKCIIYDLLATT